MLIEFDTLFDPTDPSFIGQISKLYANEALDLFLHSEVDTAMANNLETYQGGCSAAKQTNGIHVLRYLQRRYAPLDDVDEQVEATKNLEGMTRGDNERMSNFNSRFNAQVQYVRSCGIPVLPRDQLTQYLRTLRRCDAPDIHYKFDGTQNESKWASGSLLLTSKMGSNNVMMKPSVISGPKKHHQVVTNKQHSMLPAHQMRPLNPALL